MAKTGTSRDETPEPAGPDGVVGIALFKLDPDLRTDGRNDEHTGLNACRRDTRKRPGARYFAEHIGALHHDAADL